MGRITLYNVTLYYVGLDPIDLFVDPMQDLLLETISPNSAAVDPKEV